MALKKRIQKIGFTKSWLKQMKFLLNRRQSYPAKKLKLQNQRLGHLEECHASNFHPQCLGGQLCYINSHPHKEQRCGDSWGKAKFSSFVLSILRLNSYTADNIQISSHEKRVEKMNCCCFEQDTVSFRECKSFGSLVQLKILLIINGKQSVMLWHLH